MIWKTIIGFGAKGRALVLQNIFEILDRDLIPQHRIYQPSIRKNIFWFLGENGNVLVDEVPEHYTKGGNVSLLTRYCLSYLSSLDNQYRIEGNCVAAVARGVNRSMGSAERLH